MINQIQNLNSIFKNFKIKAECVRFKEINNYFYYDLKLGPAAKIKSIENISNEIALALQAPSKPSIKILHEEGVVRLEFFKKNNQSFNLLECLNLYEKPNYNIPCLLGYQVNGLPLWMDLSQNPHIIVGGTTGSGKSTILHNIIANIIYYNSANIYLIDPKNIEFAPYQNRYFNINVFYDYHSALSLLNSLIEVMEYRFSLMRNGVPESNFTSEVVIIDEFADLIMQDTDYQFYNNLCRLAQKCRAAKIYLVLSTQRPSTNIINGMIKANFPARISCKVSSHIDSKIILDSSGAENLMGKGDAIIKDNFRNLERFQVAYVSPKQFIN
jgi:S-DNA-T family DNA segregation ATPase FtsK/SpoIIIE